MKGAWTYHFFPLFDFGRPRPGDLRWRILYGLIGYERSGTKRTLKLLWAADIALKPAVRIAPPLPPATPTSFEPPNFN